MLPSLNKGYFFFFFFFFFFLIEPDLSALTVLRLRDRCWGLCYFWYTFRLWVISSANTASATIYMLKIHRFIQHSPMLTPKNLLRPIQEWIKNCILVAFRDLDGSQQTEAQQRKTKLLLLHLIFRRCLTLDSLTLRNDNVYTSDHARNIGVVFDTIHWR